MALHVFHRLEQLMGRTFHRDVGLTDREREFLAWAAEGKTAWEIGCILSLSQRTIEWHFLQACKKLEGRIARRRSPYSAMPAAHSAQSMRKCPTPVG